MRALVLICVALLAGAPLARANGGVQSGLIATCAELPAPPTLDLAIPLLDGGIEDVPAAIHKGQPAPADGVFFTTRETNARTEERARLRAENDSLRASVQKLGSVPPWVWLVTCTITTVAGAYVSVKLAGAGKK